MAVISVEASFQKDLEDLINRHCLDNLYNTPDYVLAEYLTWCLSTLGTAIEQRDKWFGVMRATPASAPTALAPEDQEVSHG